MSNPKGPVGPPSPSIRAQRARPMAPKWTIWQSWPYVHGWPSINLMSLQPLYLLILYCTTSSLLSDTVCSYFIPYWLASINQLRVFKEKYLHTFCFPLLGLPPCAPDPHPPLPMVLHDQLPFSPELTPKGPLVSTEDNQFWSVSLELILFLDFLKLFVKMRLVVSFAGEKKSYFLDLRIKSYGCLKFWREVWAGRAWVEPTSKSWLHQPKMVGNRNKESWEKPFESFLSNLLNLRWVKSSLPHGAWRV
jgi:hypothetical protein